MTKAFRGQDPVLNGLVGLITLLGLAFIFSAGYPRALANEGSPIPSEFRTQIILLVISFGAFLFVSTRPQELWKKRAKLIGLASFLSLIAVELVGKSQNGAKRWLGVPPIAIQPAEFAKLAIILFLAAALANRKPWRAPKKPHGLLEWTDRIGAPKIERAWPFLVLGAFFVLIEMEKDLGTGAVVMVTGIAMLFIAGISNWSKLLLFILVLGGVGFFAKKEAYRVERIMSHFSRWNPDKVDEEGFQTCQAELAMASGGIGGVGIGNGRAKHILPATTTDYIMATVAEESGLAGPLIALGLVGGIVARLWSLARVARDRFSSLALMGIGIWIAVQATTNTMMANATLPSIGIPFPFLSSGGSSLLALWLAMGIAQSLTRQNVPQTVGTQVKGEDDAVRDHGWRDGRTRLSGA